MKLIQVGAFFKLALIDSFTNPFLVSERSLYIRHVGVWGWKERDCYFSTVLHFKHENLFSGPASFDLNDGREYPRVKTLAMSEHRSEEKEGEQTVLCGHQGKNGFYVFKRKKGNRREGGKKSM